MADNDIFEVERIVDERSGEDGHPEYKIKWAGYDISEASWEPTANILDPSILRAWKTERGRLRETIGKHNGNNDNDDTTGRHQFRPRPSLATEVSVKNEVAESKDDVGDIRLPVPQKRRGRAAFHQPLRRSQRRIKAESNMEGIPDMDRQPTRRSRSSPPFLRQWNATTLGREPHRLTLSYHASPSGHSSESDDAEIPLPPVGPVAEMIMGESKQVRSTYWVVWKPDPIMKALQQPRWIGEDRLPPAVVREWTQLRDDVMASARRSGSGLVHDQYDIVDNGRELKFTAKKTGEPSRSTSTGPESKSGKIDQNEGDSDIKDGQGSDVRFRR